MTDALTLPSAPIFNASRSIGDILVTNGRLSEHDAAEILQYQKVQNLQFGDAAIALKLLTKEDIDFALSQQYDYAYLNATNTCLSPSLLAAYQPFGEVSENLRAVRSQLTLRWLAKQSQQNVLAVVSPSKNDGRSFVAANLATVFAQQGQRTLLIDADLRSEPDKSQQSLFKLERGSGLSGILANRAGLEAAQLVPGLPHLAVLPGGAVPPNPQELLGRLAFGNLLEAASLQFDIILIDTPAGSDFADAEIIAARAGNALLVCRKNQTLVPEAVHLAQRLQGGGVALIGSILNDA